MMSMTPNAVRTSEEGGWMTNNTQVQQRTLVRGLDYRWGGRTEHMSKKNADDDDEERDDEDGDDAGG